MASLLYYMEDIEMDEKQGQNLNGYQGEYQGQNPNEYQSGYQGQNLNGYQGGYQSQNPNGYQGQNPNGYQGGYPNNYQSEYQGLYPGYQNGMPEFYQNRNYDGLEEPVSIGEWIITLLVMMIPCVNFIMMLIWAFSSSTKKSKSNLCKAYLIVLGAGLAIYLLIAMCLVLFAAI